MPSWTKHLHLIEGGAEVGCKGGLPSSPSGVNNDMDSPWVWLSSDDLDKGSLPRAESDIGDPRLWSVVGEESFDGLGATHRDVMAFSKRLAASDTIANVITEG